MTESDQLRFWRAQFGNEYTRRGTHAAAHLRERAALWAPIIAALAGAPPTSILEVGANIGNNLRALRQLTDAELFAVEPNAMARDLLITDQVIPAANVHDGHAAAMDLPDAAIDLVFTSGVLIHVHPDDLAESCREIHRVASRYIACIEYFADQPREVPYRGHAERLFTRDFGSFWLDLFPDLETVDYGFIWKRLTGHDNLTWWLFRK